MSITIQPHEPGDISRLIGLHEPHRDEGRELSHLFLAERLWIIAQRGRTVGYAAAVEVPGLEAIFELSLFIARPFRGQGLGSRLLAHVNDQLGRSGARQISHPVADLDGRCARFLRRHGFAVEHQEWQMRLATLEAIPPAELPVGYELTTYSRRLTIQQLLRLSDECFRGLPWHQPFSYEEIAATLRHPGDALFLTHNGEPAGFVWTHFKTPDSGQIEPIGVLPAYQRKGLGRQLMLGGLHHLQAQGARQVDLGVWQDNHIAIQLYRSLGFEHVSTLTYMALDLSKQ